jgi:hypothetical protein
LVCKFFQCGLIFSIEPRIVTLEFIGIGLQ